MPNEAGLGVHLTIDLGGQASLVPMWNGSRKSITTSIRIVRRVFTRRFARIGRVSRTTRCSRLMRVSGRSFPGPGQPAADFVIQGQAAHGMAGLVNLFGIESPGLTASLAIAEKVARMLG